MSEHVPSSSLDILLEGLKLGSDGVHAMMAAAALINAASLDWLGLENSESAIGAASYLTIVREPSHLVFLLSSAKGDSESRYQPYDVLTPDNDRRLGLERRRIRPPLFALSGLDLETAADHRTRDYFRAWSHRQSGLDTYAVAIVEEALSETESEVVPAPPTDGGPLRVFLRDDRSRYEDLVERQRRKILALQSLNRGLKSAPLHGGDGL